MSRITLAFEDLAPRARQITEMLSPLKTVRPLHCGFFPAPVGGGKALVAHDGFPLKDSHREYPFRLANSAIDCKYFELWTPCDNTGRTWNLVQAYFTVLLPNRQARRLEELLCVHCDPQDESDEPTCWYKRSPHLHVEKAEHPLPKCHFPLCCTSLRTVSDSLHSLTSALHEAVKAVQDEVVGLYPAP